MTIHSVSPQGNSAFGLRTYPACWEDMACNAPSPTVPLRAIPCRFQPPCPTVPRPDTPLETPLPSALLPSLLVPYLAPLLLGLPMKGTAMSCPLYSIRMKAMSKQSRRWMSMMQLRVRPLTKDAGGEAYAEAKARPPQLIQRTTPSQPLLVSLRTWQERLVRLPWSLRTVPSAQSHRHRLGPLSTPMNLPQCSFYLHLY